jgi:hypothetical protein
LIQVSVVGGTVLLYFGNQRTGEVAVIDFYRDVLVVIRQRTFIIRASALLL